VSPPAKDSGPWTLVPYINATGRSPVLKFLKELQQRDRPHFTQFSEVIKPQLEKYGPFAETNGPYWKNLPDKLFEIKFQRYRIYCSVEHLRTIVLYEAVEKRWSKFRAADADKCANRRDDFRSAEYDQEQRGYLYRNQQQKKRNDGTTGL